MITRIISGGQTGADRGGLDAAIYCDVPYSGYCPKGRKAEDGAIPAKYKLQEMSSANYLARTEANAVDSDATVIFTHGNLQGGSLRTAYFAQKHGKPWLYVDLGRMTTARARDYVLAWLHGDNQTELFDAYTSPPNSCVLNVAGSRESKAPGIGWRVECIMVEVLIAANRLSLYPMGRERLIGPSEVRMNWPGPSRSTGGEREGWRVEGP